MIQKNSCATSTTVGCGSIQPTMVSPTTASTAKVTTPQARQNQLHWRSATRTRWKFPAPQFCPTNGAMDDEADHSTICTIVSTRCATV